MAEEVTTLMRWLSSKRGNWQRPIQSADNQKAVVNNTVLMLKGNGTVNGSNVWTLLSGGNSVILPYVPKDDSTAYLQGYALDLLTANTVCYVVQLLVIRPITKRA